MADDGSGEATTFTKAEVEKLVAEQVAGLKGKNDELLGKLKAATEAVRQFEGLDPEQARKALEEAKKAEAEKAKAVGDWDAREKQLREEFAAQHAKVVEPLTMTAKQLEADLFEAVAVRDALAAMPQKHIKGNPDLLLPIIRPELGVEVIDGKRTTIVKGPDGKARYNATTGKLVTVEERLVELRAVPKYAGAFEGAGGSGGGAEGGAGGGGGTVTVRAGDEKAFLANLGDIAKGKAKVAP